MQDSDTELIDDNEEYSERYAEEAPSDDEDDVEQADEVNLSNKDSISITQLTNEKGNYLKAKNTESRTKIDVDNYSSDDDEEEVEIELDPTKTILHTTGIFPIHAYPFILLRWYYRDRH